jgi:hypothetical protein
VTVDTFNAIRFPNWHGRAELALSANVEVPTEYSTYMLWFSDINGIKPSRSGTVSDGQVNFSDTPSNLGFTDGTASPAIYTTILVQADGATPVAFFAPVTYLDIPWTSYAGYWATTYGDYCVDFQFSSNFQWIDPLVCPPSPMRWWHDMALFGWFACGACATDGESESLCAWPSDGQPQTWPMRFTPVLDRQYREWSGKPNKEDLQLLKQYLSDGRTRNFYGYGHGNVDLLLGTLHWEYKGWVSPKRFRFVFLDGCGTAKAPHFFDAFGACQLEVEKADSLWNICRKCDGDQTLHGPVDRSAYGAPDYDHPNLLGRRPGVYLGWNVDVPISSFEGPWPYDYNSHRYLPQTRSAALAHWHEQLLYHWRDEGSGRKLLDSIDYAISEAAQGGCYPQWDLEDVQVGVDRNRNPIYFTIQNCLVLAGDGTLKFNELNHAADTW